MPHRAELDPHKFRRRGVLFVLSSPSGAGKSTIARKLLAADPFLEMSVSYTTRPMRPGEQEGVDYHFVDLEKFREMVANNEFLEWAHVFDQRYGTPKATVDSILRSGRVASYPIAPAKIFPTFLLDFSVFPGNSGGPVYMTEQDHRRSGAEGQTGQDVEFIAGLLTQQVELNSERLEIGIVTHAKYIRETLNLLDDPAAPVTLVAREADLAGAKAASAEEAVSPD